MKKVLLVFSFLAIVSCGDEPITTNCFRGINVDKIIDFNLPEYQPLLINGGKVITTINGRRIQIIRNSSTNYLAFDLQCPDQNCSKDMTFDGVTIRCLCNGKKYNYLNGGAPLEGNGCAALLYFVQPINDTSIRITK